MHGDSPSITTDPNTGHRHLYTWTMHGYSTSITTNPNTRHRRLYTWTMHGDSGYRRRPLSQRTPAQDKVSKLIDLAIRIELTQKERKIIKVY